METSPNWPDEKIYTKKYSQHLPVDRAGKERLHWNEHLWRIHTLLPQILLIQNLFHFFFSPNNSISKDRANSFLLKNTFKTNLSYSDRACCGSAVSMLKCSPKILTVLCWFLLYATLQPSDRTADKVNQKECLKNWHAH